MKIMSYLLILIYCLHNNFADTRKARNNSVTYFICSMFSTSSCTQPIAHSFIYLNFGGFSKYFFHGHFLMVPFPELFLPFSFHLLLNKYQLSLDYFSFHECGFAASWLMRKQQRQ